MIPAAIAAAANFSIAANDGEQRDCRATAEFRVT